MEDREILCYGDSNTWGYSPPLGSRYPRDIRWPCVMAKDLGQGYHVTENGIGGRTTVFDDPWSANDCRNGAKGLSYALTSAKPLDLVVVMLGTNDMKFTDVYGSARGAETLVKMILTANERYGSSTPIFYGQPRVLLISPIPITEAVERRPVRSSVYGKCADTLLFAREFARVASQLGIDFMDAGLYAHASDLDGIHMDADSHVKLGHAAAQKVRDILL